MAKASYVDFMQDVTHFAAFGFMVQAKMIELEDARKKIVELEAKLASMQPEPCKDKECKCSCEDECLCCEDKEPTIEDLYEMAKFLVDTTPDLMEINIETIYKNDKDEEEDDE